MNTFYFVSASILLLVIVTFSLYVMIRTKINYYLKFLLIPSIFGFTFFAIHMFHDILGKPYYQYPEKEFILVHYRVVHGEPNALEVWVTEKGEVESRLYQIPYDQAVKNLLQKAQESQQKGKGQYKFKFNKRGELGEANDGTPGKDGKGRQGNSRGNGDNPYASDMQLYMEELPAPTFPPKE